MPVGALVRMYEEQDLVACVSDTYTGFAGEVLVPCRYTMPLGRFLRGGLHATKVWKTFLDVIDEYEKGGVVFSVGRDLWVLSNVVPTAMTPGVPRVFIPANSKESSAYSMPLETYTKEQGYE